MLGRYSCAPRQGHLTHLRRIIGYLKKFPYGAIRFRTGIPDHSQHTLPNHEWLYTVYGDAGEELPSNMPPPKGKPIRTSTYKDANFYHDLTTGRTVSHWDHGVTEPDSY
jgi:hypothetical protein